MQKLMGNNFCDRAMLQLDQQVFKEYVNKLVHAQEHHLRITRNAAQSESK